MAKKAVAKKTSAKVAGKKVVKKTKAAEQKAAGKVGAKAKTAEKKVAKKVATKVKALKKTVATKVKRAPNPVFMKPMQISEDLAKVVGSKPMPRTEVTRKIWDYIKKNKLQDAKNKREINADEHLQKVFGGKNKVSMFEMTKLVNKHLS
ncbi:MAG: SWIB/MDM2 domain-containing protein [Nitrospirota bacterium]|nr:SWIB/MDM2 domain-containing protein [Nitrospirota bacterium]